MKLQDGSLQEQATCAEATWIHDFIVPAVDFPKPGVTFQWYASLLRDPEAFERAISVWLSRYQAMGCPDVVAGIDSRGFFLGGILANRLKVPFVMIRKPGKLPNPISSQEQSTEYATTVLEVEEGSIRSGQNVLIVDDVIATGGTAIAACEVVEKVGARVYEVTCLIELVELGARAKLKDNRIFSLLAI